MISVIIGAIIATSQPLPIKLESSTRLTGASHVYRGGRKLQYRLLDLESGDEAFSREPTPLTVIDNDRFFSFSLDGNVATDATFTLESNTGSATDPDLVFVDLSNGWLRAHQPAQLIKKRTSRIRKLRVRKGNIIAGSKATEYLVETLADGSVHVRVCEGEVIVRSTLAGTAALIVPKGKHGIFDQKGDPSKTPLDDNGGPFDTPEKFFKTWVLDCKTQNPGLKSRR